MGAALGGGSGGGTSSGGAAGGGAGRDLACFVFNERVRRFAYWGRNSDLALVPMLPPTR